MEILIYGLKLKTYLQKLVAKPIKNNLFILGESQPRMIWEIKRKFIASIDGKIFVWIAVIWLNYNNLDFFKINR